MSGRDDVVMKAVMSDVMRVGTSSTKKGVQSVNSVGDTALRLCVAARTLTAENIVAFELASVDGMPLPAFTAGAHIEVDCGGMARHYSICSDPSDPMHYTIAVQHEKSGKGGSRYLYDNVHMGDIVLCSLPRNHFRLHSDVAASPEVSTVALANGAALGADTLLVAGGIGITPLLAMAWRLHHDGHAFQLHDFAASAARQVFKEQMTQFPWHDRVTRHVGRCEDFMPIVGSFESGRHLYVCGPFTMIDAVLDAARAMGWPETHLHCERFSAPVPTSSSSTNPGDPGSVAHTGIVDTAFEVELASSGKRIAIAADQSVGAALIAAGVNVPMSCEQGVCGSCLTRVLAGTPDHRDWILSPEEQAANDQFTPCCSRSCSPLLILDL